MTKKSAILKRYKISLNSTLNSLIKYLFIVLFSLYTIYFYLKHFGNKFLREFRRQPLEIITLSLSLPA